MKATVTQIANSNEARLCRRVMAFEMQTGGHHPSYIRNFATQWSEKIPETQIDFLVTQDFARQHSHVFELVNSIATNQVRMIALSEDESYRVRVESKLREFAGWQIFCKYARELEVDKGMLMYSDHFQLPMLLGQRSPCPVSCIYFRPTFHYGRFQGYRPNWKQRIAAMRKKWMLNRLLKLEQMDVLYCLDPFAVEYIDVNFDTKARIRQLPDSFVRAPVTHDRVEQLSKELGIDPNRKVLLLLGILDRRKGPLQLLDAISRLSQESKRRTCLLMAGKIDEQIEAEVLEAIGRLQDEGWLQIVLRNEYIVDTQVQDYYEIADVALTTYQQHMGMSSALIRAAMAKVPVLSASYGLMGELVVRHKMGLVTDTTDLGAFAQGLEKVIDCDDNGELFDTAEALRFADSHSPDALGDTLLDWIEV